METGNRRQWGRWAGWLGGRGEGDRGHLVSVEHIAIHLENLDQPCPRGAQEESERENTIGMKWGRLFDLCHVLLNWMSLPLRKHVSVDHPPSEARSWSQSTHSRSKNIVQELLRLRGGRGGEGVWARGEPPAGRTRGISLPGSHPSVPTEQRGWPVSPTGRASSVDSDQSHLLFRLYAFRLTCFKKRHCRIIVLFYKALGSTLSRSCVKTGHLCWSTIISNKYL